MSYLLFICILQRLSALTQSLMSIDAGGGEDEVQMDEFPTSVSIILFWVHKTFFILKGIRLADENSLWIEKYRLKEHLFTMHFINIQLI